MLLVLPLATQCAPVTAPIGAPAAVIVAGDEKELPGSGPVAMAGWFHIIWNGGPRYVLVDERGTWTTLVIADELLRPLGGGRALARQRVRIVGERLASPADTVRVLGIDVDKP